MSGIPDVTPTSLAQAKSLMVFLKKEIICYKMVYYPLYLG